MLGVVVQDRRRYFRLASPEVAWMLETILVVAAAGPEATRLRATPRVRPELRESRTCYDHLAGQLGVAIADALLTRGLIELGDEAGEATEAGRAWLARFGVSVEPVGKSMRMFCRPCLDWSERRPHLAGRLGAAPCNRCEELGWIDRAREGRIVTVTESSRSGFADAFAYRMSGG
ncbi:transcriptional regulator [Methylobacterium sp. J-030]|uniref:transcriptional regulator n=1 Tax=Methylobacterium sp. J-030 TaxID=2836627 RepID=UPI001FBBF229|nr:transcriptional regulator [Methylobacterium sp. J-030]MCJ2068912.1 transcriptional regulator [Methylobacterium sp. J-030]